ncbi:hypothetical protein FRB94_000972 [Tulasnella sp. JGI-2019a]|nr:hypothetical protein FRB94_000972 [Tulasnella sp. JGI-2019a]
MEMQTVAEEMEMDLDPCTDLEDDEDNIHPHPGPLAINNDIDDTDSHFTYGTNGCFSDEYHPGEESNELDGDNDNNRKLGKAHCHSGTTTKKVHGVTSNGSTIHHKNHQTTRTTNYNEAEDSEGDVNLGVKPDTNQCQGKGEQES